ncbi:MAG: DUF1697 domain-containing protein [Candidatus Wallbacteria bacterium]|nr:DUF1697 domain-containing protein [Candidatus Wallbacteria bacterium]
MKDLTALFFAAGCADVRSHIQSGNVIFGASDTLAPKVPGLISASILERFGLTVPVVTRSAAEMKQVVRGVPFREAGGDEATWHVAFLAAVPEPARVASLDPDRSPPDRFEVRGREIYLRCPNGLARTKLTNAYFDSRLRTTSTVRNWRTVLAVLEMMQSL